jgi:anthranilate synthase component 1
MDYYPDRSKFRQLCGSGEAVPIVRRLLSDSLTPVTAFEQIDDGRTACLFESVVRGERLGRYSFLAAQPTSQLTARGTRIKVYGATGELVDQFDAPNPLAEIRRRLRQVRVARLPDLPPFVGGAVGYVGYDAVRYTEHLPTAPTDDAGLDDVAVAFFDQMVIFDHVTRSLYVLALARPDRGASPDRAYDEACQAIDAIVERLNRPLAGPICEGLPRGSRPLPDWRSNFTRDEFTAIIRRAIEYIEAGDVFQVVLSQRLEVTSDAPPLEFYRSLRVLNPSPFMFFLRTPQCTLVGSSPEILCRVVDGEITVRPLAGTRPRGQTFDEDQALAEQLTSDPKERAEHVMLVDLGRNDVGRVAQVGSVSLPEVMVVERYSHVMHLSSTVTGRLRPDCDALDALAAALPAGTVSGAPKVRAMQIIDELESRRRGPYGGAVGYFDYTGNMDTCITLRTMVVSGNRIFVQAGAGIVADSDPAAEYQETLNKAQGMLRAIEMTETRLGRRARKP